MASGASGQTYCRMVLYVLFYSLQSQSAAGRVCEGMAGHAVTIAASLLLGLQATSGQFPPTGSQYSDRQNLFVYHPDCGSIINI